MNRKLRLLLGSAFLALAASPSWAANITIVNVDGPGEGFNDTTPVWAMPGNPATTRGAQRMNVFRAAADYWERRLVSNVTIRVEASFDSLSPCSSSGGVLGSAGTQTVHANFGGAPLTSTWYPAALANALHASDLSGVDNDIRARFNSRVDGDATCFTSAEWWYGLGEPAPASTFDFYTTVLHELGHGLGFQTFVDVASGTRCCGVNELNDAFMLKLEDHSLNLKWNQLSNLGRAASAKDTNDLHWTGANAIGFAGALSAGKGTNSHINMYAPSTLAVGSSVSHWTNGVSPNELMEPFLTSDAANLVTSGLMKDIGWQVRPVLFADDFETGGLTFWSAEVP